MITTSVFVRKPLYVNGVQVTAEEMEEMARWSGGEVRTAYNPRTKVADKFIHIDVPGAKHSRQTMAFVGDWILQFRDHFKIYTRKAFPESFDPAEPFVGVRNGDSFGTDDELNIASLS